MNQDEKAKIVRTYFEKLTASDYQGIIDMFEADGWVDSPYLGKISASVFFQKLGNASSENKLTVHDVLFGENKQNFDAPTYSTHLFCLAPCRSPKEKITH